MQAVANRFDVVVLGKNGTDVEVRTGDCGQVVGKRSFERYGLLEVF